MDENSFRHAAPNATERSLKDQTGYKNLAQHLALHTIVHEGPLVAGTVLKFSDFPLTKERFIMYLVVVRGDIGKSVKKVTESLRDVFDDIEKEAETSPLSIGLDLDGTHDVPERKSVIKILRNLLGSRKTHTEVALVFSDPDDLLQRLDD